MMLLEDGGIPLAKHCVVMAWFPRELIDAVLCCTQYNPVRNYTRWNNTGNIPIEPRVRTEADPEYEQMLHPIAGSPVAGKSVAGIVILFVDDLFGTGGTRMEQRVLESLRKDYQVGSEDWNNVTFTRQRIRWMKDSQSGSCIEVSQQKAIDELEEISVERNTKEDLHCTPAMHTWYRSLLGQINWLQRRTQFQCCYKFFQMCLNGGFTNNW